MSTRDDYSVEEWEAIRRAPSEAVVAVEQASPSGPLGRRRERRAAERGFVEALEVFADLELIAALVATREQEGTLLDALRSGNERFVEQAPETAAAAAAAIRAKGTPAELQAYANAIIVTCDEVARASSEGGARGGVSDAEAVVLGRLAAALGIEGYEAPRDR
jgi:hypothetical protein